jgi:ectoine hydroxylase-related dioxygenase (phytanoyl-CoA dioxygenase family)
MAQTTLTRHGGSLTQEQKEFYEREGYLVMKNLLSGEDMAPVRGAMEDKVSEIADALYADGLISQQAGR